MEIFALSDVGAPCHETLGRSRELSKHVARGEASARTPPTSFSSELSSVRVRTFRFRSGSNSRLFGSAPPFISSFSLLPTWRETSIKTKAVRFVPEITNGKDKIRKTVT